MTTTATLPDDIELREGEEFDFHAVAVNGTLVVTRVIRSLPADSGRRPIRSAGFAAKWGRSMPKVVDPKDAILIYINDKHVK